MRNVFHSSMDLKTWSLGGGDVWRLRESLGGRAFLEEACQGERASRVYSLTSLSLLPACGERCTFLTFCSGHQALPSLLLSALEPKAKANTSFRGLVLVLSFYYINMTVLIRHVRGGAESGQARHP